MNNKYRLVSRLYYMSAAALVIYFVFFISIIASDIFLKVPVDNFTVMPNHVTGYPVKAQLHLVTYDSLIDYRGKKHFEDSDYTSNERGKFYINNGESGRSREEVTAILSDTTFQKTITVQNYKARSGIEDVGNNFEIIEPVTGHVEAYILLKPKSSLLSFVLAARSYIEGLFILIVLLLLTRLFRQLNHNFSFNHSISRTLWLIGNCLLLYQVLIFGLSLFIKEYIDWITYSDVVVGADNTAKDIFSFNITLEGNVVTIFIGLSLVALSKLLQKGYELQQENDLTI